MRKRNGDDGAFDAAVAEWQAAQPGDEAFRMTLPEWLGLTQAQYERRYGTAPVSRLGQRAEARQLAKVTQAVEAGRAPGGLAPECAQHGCAVRQETDWEQRLREEIAAKVGALARYTSVEDPSRDLVPLQKTIAIVLGRQR